MFPLSPAESRRGLPKGSGCWCWEPATTGSLSWSTPQQPGSASWGWPMNSDASVSWVRRTAANSTVVETRGLVYFLFMPGWILTWFNNDFWSIMKEHMKGIWALATFSVHEQHPVRCYCAPSGKKSVSFWQFCFLPFSRVWIPYSSLFQRARAICLMKKYPFLIGAVTGVMCEPECMLCNNVWMCLCGLQCARSGSKIFFFFWCPFVKTNHSSADNWVCCLCRQEREKGEHLMWTCHKDFTNSNFIWEWRTLFLATVLRAPVCSLILFDWPSFDPDKKGVREPPGGSLWVWRHFITLFFSLGNSKGVARKVHSKELLCWPKVLHATSPWWLTVKCLDIPMLIYTRFFPGQSGMLAFGDTSLKIHWFKTNIPLFYSSTVVMSRLCTLSIISLSFYPLGLNNVQYRLKRQTY